jgi:hypothetical protein
MQKDMEERNEFSDADRINMENEYEVNYRTSQLKVTNDELKDAVAQVGWEIAAVKVYLNKA